jgi:hypothetical protein
VSDALRVWHFTLPPLFFYRHCRFDLPRKWRESLAEMFVLRSFVRVIGLACRWYGGTLDTRNAGGRIDCWFRPMANQIACAYERGGRYILVLLCCALCFCVFVEYHECRTLVNKAARAPRSNPSVGLGLGEGTSAHFCYELFDMCLCTGAT